MNQSISDVNMSSSLVVTLVGEDLSQEHGNCKWSYSIVASDGYVYGVPHDAHFVIRFDLKGNLTMTIGDDLGGGRWKWYGGVEANNGCIYALPWHEDSILKIEIKNQVVEKVDAKLPESNLSGSRWGPGALADDGCIYYFPMFADHILKLDPSNDTVSSVGNNLHALRGKRKELFKGTVKVDDGCLIGIPFISNRIIKFDPKEPHITTMVGEEAEKAFYCRGDGALGGDGNVYAVNAYGKILQIDVANNRHSFVAEAPQSVCGWYGAVAGMDGNIYFIPTDASRVLKYDISTMQASLIGDDLGKGWSKYRGGALNPMDGKIYCLPYRADRILSIDTNIATQTHKNSAKRTHDQGVVESSTTTADDHNRSQKRRTMIADSSSIGSANDPKNAIRSGGNGNVSTDNSNRNGRRRTVVADSSSLGSENVIPHEEDDHIENDNAINGGGDNGVAGGGGQPTMQRLLQVIEVVDRVRGMDHPHPTLMANADRMAEEFTALTDRFIEEIRNEEDGSIHI